MVTKFAPDGWSVNPDVLRVHAACACGCASVSFLPELRTHWILTEAESQDEDGTLIWFLLFGTRDPKALHEIEVQRADGEPIRRLPPVESFVLAEHWKRPGRDDSPPSRPAAEANHPSPGSPASSPTRAVRLPA